MKDWAITVAHWITVQHTAIVDSQLDIVAQATELCRTAVREKLAARPAYAVEVHAYLTDSHADYLTCNLKLVPVEARAIDLLTPNPFPEIVLFPRLHRLTNRKAVR